MRYSYTLPRPARKPQLQVPRLHPHLWAGIKTGRCTSFSGILDVSELLWRVWLRRTRACEFTFVVCRNSVYCSFVDLHTLVGVFTSVAV